MFNKSILLIALFTMLHNVTAYADLAIISHPDYKAGPLDATSIKNLFLGKRTSFPNGVKATPINHAVGSADRGVFFSSVLRMAESNHNRHWSRMRSTGRGNSPAEVASYKEILRDVAKTQGSISYIDATLVNDSVKVITVIKGFENI